MNEHGLKFKKNAGISKERVLNHPPRIISEKIKMIYGLRARGDIISQNIQVFRQFWPDKGVPEN